MKPSKAVTLLVSLFIALDTIAQMADFEVKCLGSHQINEVTPVSDGYYITGFGRGYGYHKYDTGFNKIGFYPSKKMKYEKRGLVELNHCTYLIQGIYNKKSKALDFYRSRPEFPKEIKIFHSEKVEMDNGHTWQKGKSVRPPNTSSYDDYLYIDAYLNWEKTSDGQRLVVAWLDPNGTDLIYYVSEFDTSFNLIRQDKIITEQKYSHSSSNRFKLKVGEGGNISMIFCNAEGKKTWATAYNFDTRKSLTKTFEPIEGYESPDATFLPTKDAIALRYYALENKESFTKDIGLDLEQDLAKIQMLDAYTLEKKFDQTIRLTRPEIDSLHYAGNLRKDVRYAFYCEGIYVESYDNGNYMIMLAMGNYVTYSSSKTKTTASGNTFITPTDMVMTGTNNYVVRIYRPQGDLAASQCLYRARKGSSFNMFGSLEYFFSNTLVLFCSVGRRSVEETTEEPERPPDGMMFRTGYTVDESGELKFIKFPMRRDISLEWGGTVGRESIFGIDRQNKADICVIKLKK